MTINTAAQNPSHAGGPGGPLFGLGSKRFRVARAMLASVTAYGAFRSKTAVKSVVRSVVDFGLQAMPGPANRVADYILSRRKRTLDGATPGKAAGIPGSTKNTFEDLLCRADARLDHLQILQLMQHSGCLSETSLHRYLTAAGLARRIESLESVTVDTSLGFPETRLFHALRLQQYRGEITATASDIERAYQTFKQHRLFKEAAVNLSADLLARRGNAHQLGTFLAQLQPQELTKLAPATFFGCVRLLTKSGLMDEFAWLRKAYIDALPAEQQLYFLEIMPSAEQRRLVGESTGWRSTLEKFCSVYSAGDVQDRETIEKFVVAPLRRIKPGDQDYLNIRFDPSEQRRLLGVVERSILQGRGLGLVRLGDGEAYAYESPAMPGADARLFDEDNFIRERMWWGKTIPDDHRIQLKTQVRAAVAASDIIGIPSIYRIIRDRGTAQSHFGRTGAQRGLAVVLSQLGKDIEIENRLITEERCHQLLFSRHSIETLCWKAKRVVLISCWTQAQLALTADAVHEIVVPAHTKVAKITGLTSGSLPLCDTFPEYALEMEAHCTPGTLVLVGAGILGKIFVSRAKARGAVALDVGAVLDYLAGYKTRSLADLG